MVSTTDSHGRILGFIDRNYQKKGISVALKTVASHVLEVKCTQCCGYARRLSRTWISRKVLEFKFKGTRPMG
jgi:hypothetical protein